jgi:hypothetical protein
MTDHQFTCIYDMLERLFFVLAEVRDKLPSGKTE